MLDRHMGHLESSCVCFLLNLVVEFIKKKVHTFSSIRDHTTPKSLKCSNSATK